MKHTRLIYILGDVHGNFKTLNQFINLEIRKNPGLRRLADENLASGVDFQAMIIQCGDFAYYWPGRDSFMRIDAQADFLPGGRVPIFWIGGNHDDWDQLDALGSGITEIEKGIFYCPFGSTLDFGPTAFLLAGGAASIDRTYRLELMAQGYPRIWWEQEGISEAEMARLADVPRADIVISHTCPKSFPIQEYLDIPPGQFIREPSQEMLETVLDRYRLKRWYFGHFHQYARGRAKGCEWEAPDAFDGTGRGRSWDALKLEWDD